jgi:4'-phosphopantetheinyl transferase
MSTNHESAPGMGVDVWFVPRPQQSFDQLHETWGHWLGREERQRLAQSGLSKGRDTFLLTRLALRQLLSVYCPTVSPGCWQIERTAEGRPIVAGPVSNAPAFNLSHADNMLVIAFSHCGDPGVDLETLQRSAPAMELAQRYFSQSEINALDAVPVEQRNEYFLTLWTLKEACVKANGKGLARSLRHFSFELHSRNRVQLFLSEDEPSQDRHWRLWSARYETWRVSLALRSANELDTCRVGIRVLRWPDQKLPAEWQLDYHSP